LTVSKHGGTAEKPESGVNLGTVLAGLRKERGIPLRDMARKLDLSAGYLSQIERDLAVPSIQTLTKIADAFDTTVGRLFEQAESQGPRPGVVRREARKIVLWRGSRSHNELLVPDLKGALEVILSRVRPGRRSRVYRHAGEEFGYVLKGRIEFWVGDERFDLRTGDAIRFPATVPHWWSKPRRAAQVLWVITPPSW
jgi:transcriptional regulator with XRE-family HTH domain